VDLGLLATHAPPVHEPAVLGCVVHPSLAFQQLALAMQEAYSNVAALGDSIWYHRLLTDGF
jgi:hypothetical protein